jgi:hypothetical protein
MNQENGRAGFAERVRSLIKARTHSAACLTSFDTEVPSAFRIRSLAQDALRDLARSLVAHLMAARAAVGVNNGADPLALAFDIG